MIIDEALSWKSHVTNVARKIAKSVGIICKASFCLSSISSLYTLYYSLVYPYFVYCIFVWGSTYISNFNRIVFIQKKVIRIISKSAFDAHIDPLFVQFKIFKFHDIYKFQTLKFMFLFKNDVLPDLFKEMFSVRSQIHSYNIRNSNSLCTFSCRTNVRKFAIRFQEPVLFNRLNSDIKNNAESIFLFKTKLKALLN